ncbi:nephrin-like [Daphnia carinata]|uniref:nephrin-like n=1 Tax=Daphnia carinata TaxID=120202 RepID=UPI0028688F83|nr:nephrin-like [Daphnia carinata]
MDWKSTKMLHLSFCLLLITLLSTSCDGQQQQQYFAERPQNTSVREGQMAVLRCRVGNQQGRAQWTKDGFALGFERTIPSFPRYTIMGSEEQGEHHIRIENATLDDDAEYQCQVGPRGNSKPIRADAQLTVLIPPSSVEIVDYVAGSRIMSREGEELLLQCLVRNAKPAAEIVWFKRNVEIKSDRIENTTTDADVPRRFDTRSKLTIRAQPDDNEADYTCEARHPALIAPKRATVALNILYPPGPPEIIGYTEGETVRMGQEVKLECISRGGNPLAQIVWYKNEVKIDHAYETTGRESRNVHIFRAEASDNNARFRCEASNALTATPMKAEITLTVHFGPKTVTVTGPSEAKVNDTVSLECTTTNSNPVARITWVVDGREVRENGSRIATSPDGGWVSSSNLTTTIRATGRNVTVSCHAIVADLAQRVAETKIISVVYPPEAPSISGMRDRTIRDNSFYQMNCMSMGGNPPATLKWFLSGSRKEIKANYTSHGSVAQSLLEMQAKREDNGKELRCEATNPALEGNLVDSTTIRIEFAPKQLTVKVRPEKLRPGQMVTITCESDSSNPVSRLTWLRGNGQVIQPAGNSTVPGAYSGIVSKSTLQMEVTPELHGVVITCQATNGIGPQIHDAITLEVLYKPHFPQPADYSVDVIEGEPAIVNLTAKANPSEITYKWFRDGTAIKQLKEASAYDRMTFDGAFLNLTVVRRDDKGDYKCEATNAEGSRSHTVRLNVQYPASIVQVRPTVMINEGSDAEFECRAAGNPLTTTTVFWRRAGFDMDGRTSQTPGVGVAYLLVREITRNDTGAFECVANNGIGQESIEQTWLVVKYKPVMDDSPQLMKAAGDEGQLAKLVCRAQGAPNISFGWSREGTPLTPSDKYSFSTRQVDIVTWESTMEVGSVRSRDYGLYDCVARNEMGINTAKVVLSGTSRPDPPLALHVVNVSHDSVYLAWRSGFDGGLFQSYRLRYRQIGNEFYKYADVYPTNMTAFTLGGLALGTEYLFGIMAFNNLGESNFTQDIVKARTSSEAPPTGQKPRDLEVRPGDMPKVLIIVITIVGTALLVLNVALIACFVRRRHRKRLAKAMSSEGGSSKSATIEMYAPSSYNETVNGETLSSISEKSESYSQNGSHSDYAPEDATKVAVSTYLIDQADGQVAYGSYRVAANNSAQAVTGHGTLSRPPKSVNFDMGEDNYIDTLRRNAYSQGNEAMYGKSRMVSPISPHSDAYYGVNANSPVNYPPAPHPSFHTTGTNHRYNPLSEPTGNHGAHSPYTPMGTLNIPAANGVYGPSPSSSGRASALPVNLPLPLPMSMQGHSQFSSFNPSEGPSPIMEATAQFSGPSLATVRSLETEGHLV